MSENLEEKKPIYKKWWFWVIIIVLLVAIAGGTSSIEPTKVGKDNNIDTTEQAAEEKSDFAIGDIIAYEGREVTITSVERNYNTNNEFYQPESGKEFIRVSIKIENKGEETSSNNCTNT